MYGQRRRINGRQYISRLRHGVSGAYTTRAYKRRRFIPASPRAGWNSRYFRFTPRVLGNPLAITERKYYDLDLAVTTIASSATDWNGSYAEPTSLQALFVPQQGNGFSQRVGRQIQVIKFSLRGTIERNPLSGSQFIVPAIPPQYRMIVFIDQQTNAGRPTGNDVMQSAGSTNPIFAFQNANNFGRFRVLKDKLWVAPQMHTWASVDGQDHQHGYTIPFKYTFIFKKPILIHFNGTNSGTITDIIDNSFHLMCLTDTAGAPLSFITYKGRFVYYDM